MLLTNKLFLIVDPTNLSYCCSYYIVKTVQLPVFGLCPFTLWHCSLLQLASTGVRDDAFLIKPVSIGSLRGANS